MPTKKKKPAAATKAGNRKPFCFITDTGKMVGNNTLESFALKSQSRQATDDKAWQSSYKSAGIQEPLYPPSSLLNLLEINVIHARCCDAKARDASGLGWNLTPNENDPSENNKTTLETFFNRLDSETLYRYQYDWEALGYGVMELIRQGDKTDGEPDKLIHIPAHTCRRHKDGVRVLQQRGTQKVWFKIYGYENDVDYKTGDTYPLGSVAPERRANEVFWGINYTPRSTLYGLPDIAPAIGTISGDFSRREFNRKFFDNFGVPAYAVWITGNFEQGEIDEETGESELAKAVKDKLAELPKNPHSTLVMTLPSTEGEKSDIEVEFQPLATEVKDASFRLYRKDNRDETIVAHGVPPYRIGIYETGALAGNLGKEATEIYKRSIVEPRQQAIETLINTYIIQKEYGINDWEWELAEIDTADEKHEMEMLGEMFARGAVTPNELRQYFSNRFGLEPKTDIPELDAHYVNNAPISAPQPDMEIVERALKEIREQVQEIATKNGKRNILGIKKD